MYNRVQSWTIMCNRVQSCTIMQTRDVRHGQWPNIISPLDPCVLFAGLWMWAYTVSSVRDYRTVGAGFPIRAQQR